MKTNKQKKKNPKSKKKHQKPGHREWEWELFETTYEKQTYLFASESIYTCRYSNI